MSPTYSLYENTHWFWSSKIAHSDESFVRLEEDSISTDETHSRFIELHSNHKFTTLTTISQP